MDSKISQNKEIVSAYFQYWAKKFGIMDEHGSTWSDFLKIEESRQQTTFIGSSSIYGGNYNYNDGDW